MLNISAAHGPTSDLVLKLDTAWYFTTRGLDVLMYNNGYNESLTIPKSAVLS